MKSLARSAKQKTVDIADYYAIKVGPIWRGLKQESAAFWWLCIYLFFEYVRPQSIYTFIDILPWSQVSLLLALVTMRSDPGIKWVKNPANVLFSIFMVIVFLSCIFAFRPSASFEKIDIVINWIVLYFLIITLVNTEKRFFIFVLLFLLASFKMSQHGALSYAARGFSFARWGVTGSPGWFANAADFGTQLTIFVPLAMAFILSLKKYWGFLKRWFFYLFPLTGLLSIVATGSRGTQLAMVGVGFWFLLKSRNGFKAILGVLVVGWVLYSILPEEMKARYETAGDDSTSRARLAYWGFGMDIMKDHPVLGIGYDNWLYYCYSTSPFGYYGKTLSCLQPHNTYVEAVAEIGVPGLIVYVSMMLVIFRLNARARQNAIKRNNKFVQYMAYGLDGGLVGYMISSFFITILFYPMFWIQLAMTVALHEVSRRGDIPKDAVSSSPALENK